MSGSSCSPYCISGVIFEDSHFVFLSYHLLSHDTPKYGAGALTPPLFREGPPAVRQPRPTPATASVAFCAACELPQRADMSFSLLRTCRWTLWSLNSCVQESSLGNSVTGPRPSWRDSSRGLSTLALYFQGSITHNESGSAFSNM